MSGLFRSEDMTYVRIIMDDASAYDTVRELGRFKRLHVLDLSNEHAGAGAAAGGAAPVASSGESSYTYYKKRVALCQFWERKLQSFRDAFNQYRIRLPDALDPSAVRVDDVRSADVVEDCKNWLDPIESSLAKNVLFRRSHKAIINGYVEYQYVLKFNKENRFSSAHSISEFSGGQFGRLGEEEHKHSDVEAQGYQQNPARDRAQFTSTICGVLPADKIIAFERLLFRVSRGNAFSHFFEIPQLIEDPGTDEPVRKHVFAVTFMGEQLARRISRIVGHNGGTEYPIPGTPLDISRLEQDIQAKLNDSISVLKRTDAEIKELLSSLAVDPATAAQHPVSSPFLNWLQSLQKERHVCDILKKCDQEGPHSKLMTLEGWCPSDGLDELKQALNAAVRATQAKQAALQIFDHPPNHATPPTYFKTNKFTSSYQGIVDTYGVPRYKEVNPGLFTIISFPFLFGVMYGDIGHGSLLFLFALYLLWNESKFLDMARRGTLGEIPSMVFGGRYLLVMMGAFALYAGTIYNDLFSCPTDAFGSRWHLGPIVNTTDPASLADYEGQPYPYGVDPAWYHTTNELAFFNSMKMKLAVTLGVTQMVFGICLGALNDIYFKETLHIFFEFIPRLIFILATFGYMVFIILLKGATDWTGGTPPLLIQTMIKMFLSPGSVSKEDELYSGQAIVQAILLLSALFSVPVMLCPIPCITNSRNKEYLKKHGLVPGMRHPDDLTGEKEIQMHDLSSSSSSVNPNDISLNTDPSRKAVGLGPSSPSHGKAMKQRLMSDDESEGVDDGGLHRPSSSSSKAVVIDDRGEHKEAFAAPVAVDHSDDDAGHGEHALGLDYNFSDHMIVQGIHTIEFVLGTVSNTASYLRLWALSLAHAELSAVFWDKMIMQYGINGSMSISPVLGFAVWAVATFSVLLCMDVLECFLHALRLHWVEFQNKFFKADGYAFEPFSFDNLASDGTSSSS